MSHHHNFYDRADGYVYSVEELDAYRIPAHHRDVCVNLLVPFTICRLKYQIGRGLLNQLDQNLDRQGHKCVEEENHYNHCKTTLYTLYCNRHKGEGCVLEQ